MARLASEVAGGWAGRQPGSQVGLPREQAALLHKSLHTTLREVDWDVYLWWRVAPYVGCVFKVAGGPFLGVGVACKVIIP